jgi:hypothetical protein
LFWMPICPSLSLTLLLLQGFCLPYDARPFCQYVHKKPKEVL